ncbi:hypothetical protein BJX64DRAFT_261492 [Aspergillus heterothallicus]
MGAVALVCLALPSVEAEQRKAPALRTRIGTGRACPLDCKCGGDYSRSGECQVTFLAKLQLLAFCNTLFGGASVSLVSLASEGAN